MNPKIQEMHDQAVELGACCQDIDKSAGNVLAKSDSAVPLVKAFELSLDKALAPINAALIQMQKQIDAIAAQPVPVHLVGRAVSKQQTAVDEISLENELLKMSPADLAALAKKAAA